MCICVRVCFAHLFSSLARLWRAQYRPFCVIGSGGDDFVSSIIEKAELALGRSIPKVRFYADIRTRVSLS